MTAIIDIIAREILDSRGNPTVEVDVVLEDGSLGRAAVPSGASTGAHEAVELRDGDKSAISARACRRRCEAVNGEIFDAIGGLDAEDQVEIDQTMIELDGTPNKARLGANAILGVSLAVAKAAADRSGPAALPLCRRRLGARPAGADDEHRQWRRACRQSDRLPGIHGDAGRRARPSPKALRMGAEIFHTLKKALKEAGHNTNVGDEGGFAPNLPSAEGGARLRHEGDRQGRLQGRRGRDARRSTAPRPSSSRTASTTMRARARRAIVEAQVEYLAELAADYPIVVDRGRHVGGRLRRAGSC